MSNKTLIKISIKAFVFLIFFIIYWMLVAIIYSFFVFKDTSVANWIVALKIKYNLLYSLLITALTLVGYLVFLIHLKTKNKGNYKTKINKSKNSIIKELKNVDRKNIIFLNKKIGLISEKLKQHTLIVGGTGYGKTTTALTIINQLKNKLNQKIIIIDGKGDEDLIDKIKTIDNNAFIWSIGCDNVYNPLATKNNVILADKIMSLFNFSEAHYQAIAHNYLLLLIKILINKSIPITFENIVKYFPIKQLKKLVDKHENEYDVLKSFIENENDIKGLQHRLNVYLQQLGSSLGSENSLDNLTAKHDIILFSLNSFKYPELASNVGKLIIQDVKEFATIKPKEQVVNLVLDEFNVFATDAVINLINKSRSFNYQCFLCFQTLKDLDINNTNIADIIFGNTANIIAHKIKDPNTAEYLAKIFGTRTNEKITKQFDKENKTGKGSIREVEEYIVHPNDLKNLKTGEIYCQFLLPSSNMIVDKITVQKD